MRNEDERQHEDPKDVLDSVVLKQFLRWISQCHSNGSVTEEVLCDRGQQSGHTILCGRNHSSLTDGKLGAGLQDDLFFRIVAGLKDQDVFRPDFC